MKPLFAKGPSLGVRLLVLVVLSVALMVVDARFTVLKPVRSQMSLVLMQSYWIADLPQRLYQGVASQFGSRTELIAENEKLKTEALLLQGRLQKLAALTEQNVRLRELLNSSALVNEKVEVAELIGMDPNPFTHRIIINKGERDGVVLGQPVLDARGLMGQVVELMPYTSRVLLLTDTTHSIPVQVNRNGLRAIASGTGNPERLELRHVADTADIKEGDLLVSSGLGQRFPAGYPVATVKEVIHDSGQPFAIVRAVPTAALNRSRYLLLVFSDGRSPEQRATDAAQAQEAIDKQGTDATAANPSVPAAVPAGARGAAAPASAHTPATAATPAATSHATPATAASTGAATVHTPASSTHAPGARSAAASSHAPATPAPAPAVTPAVAAPPVHEPTHPVNKPPKPVVVKPAVVEPAAPHVREE
ncbi:MAG: rod shape-determining protein MreC [Pseudomonas sp.]